jgi:hypothetical protein
MPNLCPLGKSGCCMPSNAAPQRRSAGISSSATKHTVMEDARLQNAPGVWPVEHNMDHASPLSPAPPRLPRRLARVEPVVAGARVQDLPRGGRDHVEYAPEFAAESVSVERPRFKIAVANGCDMIAIHTMP